MADLRDDLMASYTEHTPNENTPGEGGQQGVPAEQRPAGEPGDLTGDPFSRDAVGRFAPRVPASNDQVPPNTEPKAPQIAPGQQPQAPAQGQQPVQGQPAQPQKAPASWRPEEREGWEKIDPRHQAAISRREGEVNTVLQRTAAARQFAQEMAQVIQPFMPMIQEDNSTPMQAVQNMMTYAAILRTAPPAQKAKAVASLISQFNVPIEELDTELQAVLKNRPQQSAEISQLMSAIDQRLAPVQQFMQGMQQSRAQQSTAEVSTELETFFNDPAHEFAHDVANEMADLMELAAHRGQKLSLQDAYKRATMAHPEIARLVSERTLGQTAAQRTAAAGKAKSAAVSLPSSAAPGASSGEEVDDGSLRSALRASIREHNSRT